MIVLLDARSPLRLGRRRRRRRQIAGQQRSEVVWEQPPGIERRIRATAPDGEDSLLSLLYKAT